MAELTANPGLSGDSYAAAINALVIAGSDHDAYDAIASLEAAGVRTRARVGFAEAVQELATLEALDLIVIEAAAAPAPLADALLERAGEIARTRGLGVVATVAHAQIDLAATHLLGGAAQLLCEPNAAERASAAAIARVRARHAREMLGVRSPARAAPGEPDPTPLQRLSEEMARLAEELLRFTHGEERGAGGLREPDSGYRGPESEQPEATAPEVRSVIRVRRMRGQFFRSDLFADPAWDMLLDLFASHLERQRVSVSSLCIAAAVPPTTALRWIGTLHDAGLFERQADPSDRRRAYVALSPKGLEGIRRYVAAVKRLGLAIV